MDDKILVAQLQAGDRRVFNTLVSLHFRSAYNLAYRFMGDHGGADEVVQQSFLKAFNGIQNFRMESSFKSWLYRIVANTAKNALRSRDARPMDPLDDIVLGVGGGYGQLEEQQTKKLLRAAVDHLPPKQRQALELRIYEDLSFKEIAEVMDCPFDTAKANFRHAVMNLRKVLEGSESGREVRLAFEDLDEDTK